MCIILWTSWKVKRNIIFQQKLFTYFWIYLFLEIGFSSTHQVVLYIISKWLSYTTTYTNFICDHLNLNFWYFLTRHLSFLLWTKPISHKHVVQRTRKRDEIIKHFNLKCFMICDEFVSRGYLSIFFLPDNSGVINYDATLLVIFSYLEIRVSDNVSYVRMF